MQKLDGQIEEVNRWIDGAEKKMDEMDSQGPNDATLKVVMFIFMYAEFNLSLICFLQFFSESVCRLDVREVNLEKRYGIA